MTQKLYVTLFFLSFLLPIASIAQTEDSVINIPDDGRTYTQVFDSLTSGLIPLRVPYGVLYDRVFPWSAAAQRSTGDTISMYDLFQTWFDMEHSRYDTSLPSTYSQMRASVAETVLEGRIPLLFISYNFAQIDTQAFYDGRFSHVAGILTDNNNGIPPYTSHHVDIAGLAIKDVKVGDSYVVTFNPELFKLSNLTANIQSISITDSIEGWQYTFNANEQQTISFAAAGDHALSLNITLENNTVLRFIQRVNAKQTSATSILNCDAVHRVVSSSIPFKGPDETYATTSNADWHIYYHMDGSGNCVRLMKKPVILLDGYDPLDKRSYNEIYDSKLGVNGSTEHLGDSLRLLGYDVIILNFPKLGEQVTTSIPVTAAIQEERSPGSFTTTIVLGRDGGTDYIERNAFILVQLIQQINDSLVNNGFTNEKLVVVGPSMGGQISRYALAYMEKQQQLNVPKMNHNTRLWLSFDSPHLGANLPLGLQNTLEYFGNTAQEQEAKDAFYQQIYTPAGREMLIEQKFGLNDGETVRQLYKASLSSNGLINSNGYPIQLRKVALVNGSGAGVQDYVAGDLYADRTAKQVSREIFKWKNWFLPDYNVTSSNFDLRITIYPTTALGKLTIPFGRVVPMYVRSGNVTNINSRGSMDIVPGSYLDAIKEIDDKFTSALNMPTVSTQLSKLINTHTFIPTISALGFKNPNFPWSTRVDDRNLVCTNEIPFDNYFIPKQNQDHIYIDKDNVSWIKQEIKKGQSNAVCPTFCTYADNWPTTVCNGQTFTLSIADLPTNVPASDITWDAPGSSTWPTSDLTISSINSAHTSAVITANWLYTNNPNKTITVTIANPCGADYVIERKIDIVKFYGLTPTITVNSTPTSGRWSVATNFATPPAGVISNWTVSTMRRPASPIFSQNGTNAGTVYSTMLTGDTLVWVVSASATISGCATYEDHDAYVVNGDGSLTEFDYDLARRTNNIESEKVSVRPNPSEDSWNFYFSEIEAEPKTIIISDYTGKEISCTAVENRKEVLVTCRTLSKGMYIATIIYSNGQSEKIKLLRS